MEAQSECLLLLHGCSCLNLLNLRQTKVKQTNYTLKTKPNPLTETHSTQTSDPGHTNRFCLICVFFLKHVIVSVAMAVHIWLMPPFSLLRPSSTLAPWHQQWEPHQLRPAVSRSEHRAHCRIPFPARSRLWVCSLGKGSLFAHSSFPPPAMPIHRVTCFVPTPAAVRLFSDQFHYEEKKWFPDRFVTRVSERPGQTGAGRREGRTT